MAGCIFRANDGGEEEEGGGDSVAEETKDVDGEEGLGDTADGLAATIFEELGVEGGGPCCEAVRSLLAFTICAFVLFFFPSRRVFD